MTTEKEKKEHRESLECRHGIASHPKAGLLYEKAYELGHANGWSEIEMIYGDLVELLK